LTLALAIAIVVGGLYVGANIGANDAANCIGPSVGAGLVRYRVGIALVAVFVTAGALLQGAAVSETVGKGIVTEVLSPAAVAAALLCGGVFVSIATFRKIPVSTSQAVVGAVAGVGLASHLDVSWSKLIGIAGSWVLCPPLAAVLAYVMYRGIVWLLDRLPRKRRARAVLRWAVLGSAAYTSYSLGANHLGSAIGPTLALYEGGVDRAELAIVSVETLTLLGAISIAVGALLFGKGVAETVGRSIIPLDLPAAFAVQTSAGFGLHMFSMLGVPVSSSQAVVGALMGVGLYHGINTISRRKLMEVVIGWVATPTLSGLVAFGIFALIRAIQG
jgi:inorganic phosphate transporter, PiT family